VLPWTLLALLPLACLYLLVQSYYRASSREVMRLDSITRSPVFAHLSGASAAEPQCERAMRVLILNAAKPLHALRSGACLHRCRTRPTGCLLSLLDSSPAAETLSGLSTIRAYGLEAVFASVSRARIDVNANVFIKRALINRCVRLVCFASTLTSTCHQAIDLLCGLALGWGRGACG